MSETPKRGEPLSLAQTLFVVLTAMIAVGVGYFEFQAAGVAYFEFELGPPYRRLEFAGPLPEDAFALVPLLKGLMRAVPLALFSATLCVTYALFRKTRHDRARALAVALGMFLAFIAGVVAHQALLYQAFVPAIDRERFEQAQWVGTRTSQGEQAPDIAVTTLEGKAVRLADMRGRVVLLNFFAAGGGPSGLELAELQKIWNEYHASDQFRMLAIGRQESVESIQTFAGENRFTFPMAADADRSAFGRFATEGIPRLYLISRDGKIIFQCQGYHQEETVALTTLLKTELAKRE